MLTTCIFLWRLFPPILQATALTQELNKMLEDENTETVNAHVAAMQEETNVLEAEARHLADNTARERAEISKLR